MKLTMPGNMADIRLDGAAAKLEDVRQALGREVDQLAQVAAQMGREAGAQADVAAHDAGKRTGVLMNRMFRTAGTLGPAIALLSRRRMRGLGKQARTLGHELRQVRITTEPRRSGTDLLPGIALIGGLGIGLGTGIALMYLLDPDRGKRRRQALMARVTRSTRAGREAAAQKASAFANRTVGVMADVRRTVTTGIGGDQVDEPSQPATLEWPEGTRVPVG